jgi:hypothetical protein
LAVLKNHEAWTGIRCKSQPPRISVIESEPAILAAMNSAANQQHLLVVAQPLLDLCRERYGFDVSFEGRFAE